MERKDEGNNPTNNTGTEKNCFAKTVLGVTSDAMLNPQSNM